MKLAVILGILQMSLGIIMKGFNNVYFKQWIDFFFEFIPQIVLLLVLFGWMDVLIIGKWLTPFNMEYEPGNPAFDDIKGVHYGEETLKTKLSPPIITNMIDMFLSFGDNSKTNPEAKMPAIKYYYVFGS